MELCTIVMGSGLLIGQVEGQLCPTVIGVRAAWRPSISRALYNSTGVRITCRSSRTAQSNSNGGQGCMATK